MSAFSFFCFTFVTNQYSSLIMHAHMKKSMHLLLVLASLLVPSLAQALTSPKYNQEVYYLVKFNNSQLYLTAGNTGANLTTQQGTLTNASDKQLWKFVGTSTKFQLVNKAGQYAQYSTIASRIQAADAQDESGWTLNNKTTTWELKWKGTTDSKAYMNQFGGTGVGTTLGLWNSGDQNNQLRFLFLPRNSNFVPLLPPTLQAVHCLSSHQATK